ncbi:unnamed protein product [Lasius platythorax]|uniref:Uncharacterized protein n=1 Tax=Lasius platythorax TaxID=488582 RepID=A0AAV2MYL7_9HYME
MAYGNVSYHDAVRMITDQEEAPEMRYDRYETPMRWPRLPISYADIGKQPNLASLKFKEITEANLCIEKINKELQDTLKVYIDRCTITSKGVITYWPFNIQELWEALESRDDIVQLEKMKRKVYNPEKKNLILKERII